MQIIHNNDIIFSHITYYFVRTKSCACHILTIKIDFLLCCAFIMLYYLPTFCKLYFSSLLFYLEVVSLNFNFLSLEDETEVLQDSSSYIKQLEMLYGILKCVSKVSLSIDIWMLAFPKWSIGGDQGSMGCLVPHLCMMVN